LFNGSAIQAPCWIASSDRSSVKPFNSSVMG
jgi:hypothetical protein